MTSYLIIGSGRVAAHFKHYFSLLNIPFEAWSRKHNAEDELSHMLLRCSHVLLLIADDAIVPFYFKRLHQSKKITIHMSGCLSSQDELYSAHPLMTFSHTLYDESVYREMPFILDQQEKSFAELFPDFQNVNHVIPSDDKNVYHAYCVMSGNFATVLWENAMNEFQKRWSLPKSIFFPYMQQLLKNQMTSTESVLTGPLVRRDHQTIQRHLDVLPKESCDLYRAFIEFYNETRKSS